MGKELKATSQSIAPFLRWAGSKRQLLPVLSKYWSDKYSRYVEPFAGSACFFFHLAPSKAILGDINQDLINTYKELKNNYTKILAKLYRFENTPEEYKRVRSLNPKALSPAVRAARFIYLNRFCFNGLYRTNLQGNFNVPYGGVKSGKLPDKDLLKNCAMLLKRVKLIAGDFENVLRETRHGDFVYLDPPFSVNSRRVFKEYSANGFNFADIQRLRQWMLILRNKNISFLVSYAESGEAEYLADGFDKELVIVRRNIAGFAGKRVKSSELLISYLGK